MAARDVIADLRPKKIILVGIAAGLNSEVQLGDVVVSEQIVDYELGKATYSGVTPRWSVYRTDPILLDRVRNFRSFDWLQAISIARPDGTESSASRVCEGVVLSGNKVIADEKTAGALSSVWKRAAAIEMEGAGIAAAVYQAESPPAFLLIKGISDKADSKKDDTWQAYAADAAAAFTMEFIKSSVQPTDTVIIPPEVALYSTEQELDQRALRLAVTTAFDLRELRILVSDLDIDWDDIPGDTKAIKIIEIISYLKRRRRVSDLIRMIKVERPGLLESYTPAN
jgi:nucleoside phosphorylase